MRTLLKKRMNKIMLNKNKHTRSKCKENELEAAGKYNDTRKNTHKHTHTHSKNDEMCEREN